MKTRLPPILSVGIAVGIAGCGQATDQVTLEFSSAAALGHTSVISVTTFEPIVREADSELLEFVGCEDIGPFPPVRRINPDTIAVSNLIRPVLLERESETFPLDGDWNLAFDAPDAASDSNPWGALMVYVEARGDARASERGAGQVAATLLSGCYCLRTRDEGFSDPALADLDKTIRKQCPLVGEEEGEAERVLQLQAVLPSEFHLSTVQGSTELTTPKNALMAPGPQVEITYNRCDNVASPTDCFRCESQRCDELNDLSNAPVVFQVEQPGGLSTPLSQVVLTDREGFASASIEVDNCDKPIAIAAHILGRPDETFRFNVRCVEPVESFECVDERLLAADYEAIDITTIPGESGQCSAARPELCDQVAVLYERSDGSRLEVIHPERATPVVLDYPERRAHALRGFFYDIDGRREPALVVALSHPQTGAEFYSYRWKDGALVDGDVPLTGSCAWLDSCHSNSSCPTPGATCANMNEVCDDMMRCRLREQCWPNIQPQSRVSIDVRDLDQDGFADIAIGNSGEHPIAFFYSGQSTGDALYVTQGCECRRFGQAPNAFAMANLGGLVPNPAVSDVVVGSAGGTFLKYSNSLSGRPELTCGFSSPLGKNMSVRDVKATSLSCLINETSCSAYDDVIVLSAQGVSGGNVEEPGLILAVFGTSTDLSIGDDVLESPGVSMEIVPSALPDRDEPKDPRSAHLADFNADGHRDMAVLYKASEEVHVWLGASNRAMGEIEQGLVLENCPLSLTPASRCAPLESFVTPDLYGDGRAEIAVICDPMSRQPRIRFFGTQAN